MHFKKCTFFWIFHQVWSSQCVYVCESVCNPFWSTQLPQFSVTTVTIISGHMTTSSMFFILLNKNNSMYFTKQQQQFIVTLIAKQKQQQHKEGYGTF